MDFGTLKTMAPATATGLSKPAKKRGKPQAKAPGKKAVGRGYSKMGSAK